MVRVMFLGAARGSEVAVVGDFATACQSAEDLAAYGSFECTEHCLAGPSLGQVCVAVGAGSGISGQADLDDVVQRGVRLSVSTSRETVAVGASGADRDGSGPAKGGERRRRPQPIGIVARGYQELGAGDRADALDGQ